MTEVDVLDLSVVKLPRLDPINPDSANTSPCRSIRSPSAMSSSSRTDDQRPIRNSSDSNGSALPPQTPNPPIRIVPDYRDNSPNSSSDLLFNPSRNPSNLFQSQSSPNDSAQLPTRYPSLPASSSSRKRKRSPSRHRQASGLSPEAELRFAQYETYSDDDDVTTNRLWSAREAPTRLLPIEPRPRSNPKVDNKEIRSQRLTADNFGEGPSSLFGPLPSFPQQQTSGYLPSLTPSDPYSAAIAAAAAAQAVAAMTSPMVPSVLQTGLRGSSALPALPVQPVVARRQTRRRGSGQSSRQTRGRRSHRSEAPRIEDSETGSPVGASCDARLPTANATAGSDDTDPAENEYYQRRDRNNKAAKKSRDLRRIKEEATARRARQLEEENVRLRAELDVLKSETARLHFLVYSRLGRQTPFQACPRPCIRSEERVPQKHFWGEVEDWDGEFAKVLLHWCKYLIDIIIDV